MNLFLTGGIAFSGDVPAAYRKYLLPGAVPSYAEFPEGALLLQQMGGAGYGMRYDRCFAVDGAGIVFGMQSPSLSLLYVLESSFSLDGGHAFNEGGCYLCCIGVSPSHSVRFGIGMCRILQIDIAAALQGHAADYAILSRLYAVMSGPEFAGVASYRQGDMDYRMLLLIDTLLKGRGTAWEIELLVQATFSGLVKLFVGNLEQARTDAPQAYGSRRLEAVREYIVGNIGAQLRMPQLAKVYGGSVAKLNKHYREHYGSNLQHYIHSMKMDHARLLLHDRNITVNEVAEMTGYNNANNFTRAFTAYFGYTPTAARKQDRSAENDRT